MAAEIRRVSPADSSDFESLLREYFASIAAEVGEQDPVESARRFLQRERCWAWVAYVDGAPAGTVSLRSIRDDACELKHLYVRADFRKRHVAQTLVETVHATASEDGCAQIYLDSLGSMTAAHRLYASFGYEPCEPYAEESVAHKVFMRKRLTPA